MSFKNTKKFQSAVSIINSIPAQKFTRLLVRILDKQVNRKQTSANDAAMEDGDAATTAQQLFTPQEYEMLQQTFDIRSHDDTKLLIDSICYVFEQALYHQLNPSRLYQQLAEVHVDESQADAFQQCWSHMGRDFVSTVRDRTLGAPQSLSSISWKLQLKLSQTDLSRQKIPNALFEFRLANSDGSGDEALMVEFTKDELHEFFEQLEIIQQQIDNLS